MIGFGSKKQVLIVGNDALHLYVISGKSASLYAELSASGEGLIEELTLALQTVAAPVTIVFDIVEQQYRKEVLPKVGFLDKNKVIERKLRMAFPQQQMRTYKLLQPSAADGNAATALFAAVSDIPLTQMVMKAVIDSAVAVRGAALLPLEATALTSHLVHEAHKRAQTPDDTRWSVLITHHRTGGLRQIVIHDGELALTRMTPVMVDSDNAAMMADEIAREFNATLTYLSRFRYVASDGLDLVVVSSPEVCQRLRQYNLPVTHLYPLSLSESGHLTGLNLGGNAHDNEHADILHAAWVGNQKKLRVPLSAPFLNRVKMARQFGKLATIGLAIAALYFAYQCAVLYTNYMEEQGKISQIRSKSLMLKNDVDAVSASLNTLKYDPEKTGSMLTMYRQYQQQNLDIDATLELLMAQMDRQQYRVTNISIDEVNHSSPDNTTLQQAAIEALTLIRQQEAEMQGLPASSITPPPAKAVATIQVTLRFVDGIVLEDAARATYDLLDRVQAAFPGREVVLDEVVGNLSESKTVQGGGAASAESQSQSERVSKFTIKGMLE